MFLASGTNGGPSLQVRVLSQIAGNDPLVDELISLLRDRSFLRVRGLVAFARWSGLSLLDPDIRRFLSRRDRSLDLIVGVDLGGTTLEALTYLLELPRTRVRVARLGRNDACFHPKVFLADSRTKWVSIVGSSNLSSGGLFTNTEVSVRLIGSARETNPCESLWRQFDIPEAPLSPEHVRDLDSSLLEELSTTLARFQRRVPDKPRISGAISPVPLARALPPMGRAVSPAAGGDGRVVSTTRTGALSRAAELYLELWEETGAGGTQVQVPREAFSVYFGAAPGEILWVQLRTPSGRETRRLQQFANHTFRLSLGFTSSVGRPAVLRFRRLDNDSYRVEVRERSHSGYRRWLTKCSDRRRSGAKGYGIYE